MSILDGKHRAARLLAELLPECETAGGSFAARLNHPQSIPAGLRGAVFASAKADAIAECVSNLLQAVGLDGGIRVGSRHGGDRDWPKGFVGSLTHKGTVILGVLTPSTRMSMLGVDLERVSTGDLAGIESLNTNELGPPGLSMAVAKLVSFSCKEAVFKAQYPSTGRLLGFSDVTLNSWDYGRCFNAAVRCPTPGLTVRAAVSDDWVVSVAFRPPQMLP